MISKLRAKRERSMTYMDKNLRSFSESPRDAPFDGLNTTLETTDLDMLDNTDLDALDGLDTTEAATDLDTLDATDLESEGTKGRGNR